MSRTIRKTMAPDIVTDATRIPHSQANQRSGDGAVDIPEALQEAANRVRLVLEQKTKAKLDELLGNKTLREAWQECSDELQDHGSDILPRAFFAELLLILFREEFPKENTGDLMRRRKAIAKKLHNVLSAIKSEDTVASLDITRFYTFPENISVWPGLISDSVRQACAQAYWQQHPVLTVQDLLEKLIEDIERPLPADRTQWKRKNIRLKIMEERLDKLFYDHLESHSNPQTIVCTSKGESRTYNSKHTKLISTFVTAVLGKEKQYKQWLTTNHVTGRRRANKSKRLKASFSFS